MKHNVMIGFADEMQKQAIPIPLKKLISPIKAWRAGVRGKKAIINKIDSEIRNLKFKDPSFDAAGYRAKRTIELETEGREAVERSLQEGKNVSGGESFFKKHKGKILLGGALAGGLYLANKGNESEDERRQQVAMARNYNIPQRVIYQ